MSTENIDKSSNKEEWIQAESGLNTVWSRSAKGKFYPSKAAGLPVEASEYSVDQMSLLKAAECHTHSEQCQQNYLPGTFNFCPDCSVSVKKPVKTIKSSWMRPDQMYSQKNRLAGLRCSSSELTLENTNGVDVLRADSVLPRLTSAEYRFISGNFGYHQARLIAIDIQNHIFLYLDPVSNSWVSLHDQDLHLCESGLAPQHWGCVLADPENSPVLLVPTINGVVGVRLNLPNRRMITRLLVKGSPIAAPLTINDKVLIPVDVDGKKQLACADLNNIQDSLEFTDLPEGTGVDYYPAVVDNRRVIWRNESGQLVVEMAADNIKTNIYPWLPNIEPEFCFGVPARYSNSFWQLCFDTAQDVYCYVKLGSLHHEQKTTPNPRVSTGLTHFLNREVQNSEEPWFATEKINDQGEVLIPIVEFGANPLVARTGTPKTLCVSWNTSESLRDVLNSNNRVNASLILLGEPDECLDRFTVSHPWKAEAFLYDNHLWFYHSGRGEITGWRVKNNG